MTRSLSNPTQNKKTLSKKSNGERRKKPINKGFNGFSSAGKILYPKKGEPAVYRKTTHHHLKYYIKQIEACQALNFKNNKIFYAFKIYIDKTKKTGYNFEYFIGLEWFLYTIQIRWVFKWLRLLSFFC